MRKTYDSSTICFVFENNLGHEADYLKSIVEQDSRFDNTTVLREMVGITGFRSTKISKYVADRKLQNLVSFEAIKFASPFITVNTNPNRNESNVKQMFAKQLKSMYEYEKRRPGRQTDSVIDSIHDVDGKKKPGFHDDLQRAFSLIINAVEGFVSQTLPVDYRTISKMQGNRRPLSHIFKTSDPQDTAVAAKRDANVEILKKITPNIVKDPLDNKVPDFIGSALGKRNADDSVVRF